MANAQLVQEQRCCLDLGKSLYVVANPWEGNVVIHIRQYDRWQSSGRLYPTKKGITLTLLHWIELVGQKEDVDKTVASLKGGNNTRLNIHIGAIVYINVNEKIPGVNIRQWWWCTEEERLKPSRKGVFLNLSQWEKLKASMAIMKDFVPELETTTPCILKEDHQNQMGYLMCSFCNPNYYMNWTD